MTGKRRGRVGEDAGEGLGAAVDGAEDAFPAGEDEGEGLGPDAGEGRLGAEGDAPGGEEEGGRKGKGPGKAKGGAGEVRERVRARVPEHGKPNEPAALWTAVGDLHAWEANPRWKDKKKLKKAVRILMRAMRRFGFGAPMLARKANREIIAGHTRWIAAKRLGMATVPVRYMDLSEEEAHTFALADNRIAEYGQWDDDKLGSVMRELDALDTDLADGTGFDEDEVDDNLGLEGADWGDGPDDGGIEEESLDGRACTFFLSVRGPVAVQPEVMRILREQLEAVSADLEVQVNLV